MSSVTGDWGSRREQDCRRTGSEERVRAEIRRAREQGRGEKEYSSAAAPCLVF